MLRRLPREFYDRDTVQVARELLGKCLVHRVDGTARIARIAPGASGTVTFQVNVNSGLTPQTINNFASYVYNDGVSNVGPFTTNLAPFTVDASASLTFTGQTIASDGGFSSL